MIKEVPRIYKSCITFAGPRKLNEDCYTVIPLRNGSEEGFVAIVADGVGGIGHGEIASGFTVQSLELWIKEKQERLFVLSTDELKKELNSELCTAHSILKNNGYNCGTTLTAFLATGTRYIIAHVGDTRCYMSANGFVRKLTKDQTKYEKLLDAGVRIDEKDKVKMQSTVLQCIGKGELEPRYYSGVLPPEYEILLCTDGFYRKLPEDELMDFFNSKDDGKTRLKNAAEYITEHGGSDDITAVLIKRIYESVVENG